MKRILVLVLAATATVAADGNSWWKHVEFLADDALQGRDTGLRNITVEGACQHNLKNVNVEIPREKMTVCCGPSGSGKSSLALDTIYAEGQRRYIESLSAYARQFLDQLQKPDVEEIEGLPPTIAIEQRSASSNPRSTSDWS